MKRMFLIGELRIEGGACQLQTCEDLSYNFAE